MYKVFVADKLSAEGIAAFKQYPEIEIDFAAGLSVADAIPHAAAADAIIVRSATKIKGELLAAATKVKVIGRAGIGVDNVDLDACTERGIVVLNTPDANATTTAELAIAHLFSLCRSLPAADASVRAGKWERNSMVGTEVSGKTVGIVGFGAHRPPVRRTRARPEDACHWFRSLRHRGHVQRVRRGEGRPRHAGDDGRFHHPALPGHEGHPRPVEP